MVVRQEIAAEKKIRVVMVSEVRLMVLFENPKTERHWKKMLKLALFSSEPFPSFTPINREMYITVE